MNYVQDNFQHNIMLFDSTKVLSKIDNDQNIKY